MANSSIHEISEEIRTLRISPPATPKPQQPAILCLPLELRRMIYRRVFSFTFKNRRHSRALDILYNHKQGQVDRPFPLFHANKQIHAEICDFLPPIPTCIRITAQGMVFDTFGLVSAAAQGFHSDNDFGKLSHILVQIWPPHRDRPVEMLHIWNHVRRLRDLLQKCQRIQKLTIHAQDKEPWQWSRTGGFETPNILLTVCRRIFGDDTTNNTIPGSDMETIFELFAALTNVDNARLLLPRRRRREWPKKNSYAITRIEWIMMGIYKPADGPCYVEQCDYKVIENFLKLADEMPLGALLSQFEDDPRLRYQWPFATRRVLVKWEFEEAKYDETMIGVAEFPNTAWFRPKEGDECMRRWAPGTSQMSRDARYLQRMTARFLHENFGP